MPAALRSFLSSVIGGTLLAPFYALVYYRLSEAHAGAVPPAPPRGGLTDPPPAQA